MVSRALEGTVADHAACGTRMHNARRIRISSILGNKISFNTTKGNAY